MEQLLDASLLLHMLDDIEDSIYIMRVDGADLRYYYVNRSATHFSGRSMEDVGLTFLIHIQVIWPNIYIRNTCEWSKSGVRLNMRMVLCCLMAC